MTFIEAGDFIMQPKDIENTQLYDFATIVKDRLGFDWKQDYEALWQWSVDYPGDFWSALWDWHGIIGEKGERQLIDADKMPGGAILSRCTDKLC